MDISKHSLEKTWSAPGWGGKEESKGLLAQASVESLDAVGAERGLPWDFLSVSTLLGP